MTQKLMKREIYEEMYNQEATYWWYVAKRKLVRSYITGKNILDLGCGTGAMISELSGLGFQVLGLDGSEEALKYCRKRGLVNLKRADFNKSLPCQGNTFDTVLCLDVLEHIEDDRGLLLEIKRVLKSDGRLILTVPAYQKFWTYWDEMVKHKRRYGASSLAKLVRSTGMEMEKVTYFNSFLMPGFLIRWLKKYHKDSSSDFIEVPAVVNSLILLASYIERKCLKLFNLPFGVSILVVAKKI